MQTMKTFSVCALALALVAFAGGAYAQACPQNGPGIFFPANGATNVPRDPGNTITLKWTAVANTLAYDVYFGPVGTGCNTVRATEGSTIWSPPAGDITDGASYEWKVVAKGGIACPVKPSVCATFTMANCTTSAPVLSQPPHNSLVEAGSVTLQWQSVAGATLYEVFTSIDGGPVTLAATTTNTQRTVNFEPGRTVQWAVRATAPGCGGFTSAPFTFATNCPNTAPVHAGPVNGASFKDSDTIVFIWVPQGSPLRSEIYTSTNGGQTWSLLVGDLAARTYSTKLPIGNYLWRVRSYYPGNCSFLESAPASFSVTKTVIDCTPATITLTSPANGASVASPAQFAWTAIANATSYRVWGSHEGSAPVLLARTSALNASVNLPAGAIKWRVEALREGCPPVFSAEGNFTIQTAANCGSNAAPQLLPPVITDDDPATAGKSVVLPWIAQTRGAFARVWLSENGRPFADVATVFEKDQIPVQLRGGSYRWFVQLFFAGCPPLSSAIGAFTVEGDVPRCPTGKPGIVEPANGATVTNFRIRVSDSSADERVKYRFFLIADSTNAALPPFTFTSTELDPTVQPPPGTYRAYVERVVAECPSVVSDTITFTIARAQNCPASPPQLVSPANNSQNNPTKLTFTWSGQFPAGTKFVLFIQSNDGEPTPVAATTEKSIEHTVPPGRIRWRVAAFPPGCDRLLSAENVAFIALPQGCSPIAPIGLQPPDGARVEAGNVTFEWTPVPNASKYELFLAKKGEAPALAATTTETKATVNLPDGGTFFWLVNAITNCPVTPSAINDLTVVEAGTCRTPGEPEIHVAGRSVSGQSFTVRWVPGIPTGNGTYELQKSSTADFANAETILVTGTSLVQSATVNSGATQLWYRVRALSACNDEKGPYSEAASIVVVAPRTNNASADAGANSDVTQQLFIPGEATPTTFSITLDKPWVTATPSSGPLPTTGTTVTLTSKRDQLRLGGNTFTAKVTTGSAGSGKLQSHGATTVAFPISVSLVTPVTPTGKSSPSPDSLIFGAVGHAAGQNGSFFESDMRLVNLSAQTMKYQINYTPTGTDGTVTGNTTTVEVAPNQSLALDDVVSTVFGLGEISGALGMLEVRPLTTSSSSGGGLFSTISSSAQQLLTLGSSRTYNFTPNGTFGQYIPATTYSKFVGTGKILSLLHVAQSTEYRANFGFLEASGNPVSLVARVYDTAGSLLATIPVSLLASENKQIGLMLASNGITDLKDGRVEVQVTSGSGKVTAYVSELDNATNDPFLVSAIEKGSVSANRYVVPGMAHKDLGFAFWVSDLRIHNSSSAPVAATLTFYTEGNPSSFVAKQVTIDAGEIEVLNDVVANLFGQPNGAGGSIVITTPSSVSLGVTARTYNKTTNGTYGQYLPAVTVAESVGAADRALHILQVEESTRMRTNIALTETTGNPVTVEASLILPDSIVTPVLTFQLAANEFRQFTVRDFGQADAVYNARVTVKAVSGTGKVTAHGSLIDMMTNDPALIPPQ